MKLGGRVGALAERDFRLFLSATVASGKSIPALLTGGTAAQETA